MEHLLTRDGPLPQDGFRLHEAKWRYNMTLIIGPKGTQNGSLTEQAQIPLFDPFWASCYGFGDPSFRLILT